MQHDMSTPCPNCPFRTDIEGYLRAERITEIASALARGGSFPCHKTTEEWEDEDGFSETIATDQSQQCAGASIFLAHQGVSTQLERIAARLGMAADLDMEAPVCRSVEEMLRVHGHEDGGEHCSMCNPGCEAPAGYLIGGVVVDGTDYTDHYCTDCGVPVCCSEGCSVPATRPEGPDGPEARRCVDCQEEWDLEHEEENDG